MTPAYAQVDGTAHGEADGEALFRQNFENYRDERDVVDGIEGIAAEACAFLRIPDEAVEEWLYAYERAARKVMLRLWRESAEESAEQADAERDPGNGEGDDFEPRVITVDYQIRRAHPGNGESFTLAELRALTGSAWIEILPGPLPGTVAVVDEEGALRERPYNETASVILRRTIVGDALICPAEMVQ